jgi:hypothetical protein
LGIIWNIGDGYLMEYETYIREYGANKAPHFLPRFSPGQLVFQEISYQTVIYEVRVALYGDKKDIYPPLPLWVGSYSFKSIKQAQA